MSIRKMVVPIILVALVCALWADPPIKLQYQGKITQNDTALNGLYDITFRLYSGSCGGTLLWTENHDGTDASQVTITNGLFDVILGEGVSFPDVATTFNQPLWLEIEVDGTVMSPCEAFNPVPYAMYAIASPGGGSGDNIQNQYTAQQSGPGFWTEGDGRIDGGNLLIDSPSFPGRDYEIICAARQDIYASNDLVEHVDGNKCVITGVTGPNDQFQVSGLLESNKIFVVDGGSEKVGINTIDPRGSGLHIAVDDGSVPGIDGQTGLVISNSSLGTDDVYATLIAPNIAAFFFGDVANQDQGRIGYNNVGDYMMFHTNDAEQMRITSTGDVGIGTNAPTTNLDVNGTVRIRGGTPAAGQVLTASDANGNATWEPAAGDFIQNLGGIGTAPQEARWRLSWPYTVSTSSDTLTYILCNPGSWNSDAVIYGNVIDVGTVTDGHGQAYRGRVEGSYGSLTGNALFSGATFSAWDAAGNTKGAGGSVNISTLTTSFADRNATAYGVSGTATGDALSPSAVAGADRMVIAGVQSELRGTINTPGTMPDTFRVAALWAVDNKTAGTATSYAGYFDGDVYIDGDLTITGSGGGGGIDGSGTTNYLPRWTAATTLGNSAIYQDGSAIAIGTTDAETHGLNVEYYDDAAIRGADQSGSNIYAEGMLGVLTYPGLPLSVTNIGVLGIKPNLGGNGAAVYAWNNDDNTTNYAVYANADGSSSNTNYGIYSTASGGGTNYAGYFNGDVAITGGLYDGASTGGASQVLTADGAGNFAWAAPTGGSSEWTDAGTYVYPNENSSARVYEDNSTYGFYYYSGATYGVYGSSSSTSAGMAGVYGRQTTSTEGSSWQNSGCFAGVRGQAYWGDAYHAGVYGYALDDNSSFPYAGVVGATGSSATAWGALGYSTASSTDWAGYFNGNGYFSGNVGIGTTAPSAKLDVVGVLELSNVAPADPGSDIVRLGDAGQALRVQTNYGYIDVGPVNTSWAHLTTDRTQFYTNVQTCINGHMFPYTDNVFDLGNGSSYSWEDLWIDGGIYIDGGMGASGYVLHANGASDVYWSTDDVGSGGGLWTDTSPYNYSNNNSNARVYDSAQDYVFYGYNSTTDGNSSGFYGYSSSGSSGTSYAYSATNATVKGYAYYGYEYTYGVAGWRYDDGYGRGAGAFGGVSYSPATWGALGYQTSGLSEYGGYFTSYTSGGGRRRPGYDEDGSAYINNGLGAWGDLFGADIHGSIYGSYAEGGHYATYAHGDRFGDALDIHLQNVGEKDNAILFTNVSTDVSVQSSGFGTLESGTCRVEFDETFRKVISSEIPVVVTVSPLGCCNGVYISEIDQIGFTVIENNGGRSDIQFTWIAVGRRIGYESPELPHEVVASDYTEKLNRGLHNDGDTQTDGEGLYYEDGELVVGLHPSVLPNPDFIAMKDDFVSNLRSHTYDEWKAMFESYGKGVGMTEEEYNDRIAEPEVVYFDEYGTQIPPEWVEELKAEGVPMFTYEQAQEMRKQRYIEKARIQKEVEENRREDEQTPGAPNIVPTEPAE